MGDDMYKISYVADGTTTEFAFSFPFFQCADVCVAIDGAICAPEHNFAIMPKDFLLHTYIENFFIILHTDTYIIL